MVRFGLAFLMMVSVLFAEAKAEGLSPFALRPAMFLETWQEIRFQGTLSYQLNGRTHYATDKGPHWKTEDCGSRMCGNKFVEPFDCFGNRIPKPAIPVVGAEASFNIGNKTYWVKNGATYFQTWVLVHNEIVQVLVKVEQVKPIPVQTAPEPPTIEPAPMELIPQE